jgi:uncharacterized protein (TIGR02246 family)
MERALGRKIVHARSRSTARRVGHVLITLLSAVAVLPSQTHAETTGPEGLVDGFVRSWNAHDINSLAQLFTEDADFVNVAGDRLDRNRLRTELEQVHGTFFKASKITSTGGTTRFLRPDIAIVHFTWQLDGQVDVQGNPVGVRHGVISFVAVQQGDGWRITALQNTNVREPRSQ